MGRKSQPPSRTEAEALLAAVWAAPHDDLPRLVYADFIEEAGDGERAEFIRLQVERARLEAVGGDATDGAWARERELGAAYVPASCVRGFPVLRASYTASTLPARAADPPPTRVLFGWSRPGGLGEWFASPHAAGVHELHLAPIRPWSVGDWNALAAAELPPELGLGGAGGPALLEWAAGLDSSRLRRLGLPEYRPGGDPLRALAAGPSAARLVGLDLRAVHLSNADLGWLGASAAFPRLRSLALAAGTYSGKALSALVASPLARNLRELAAEQNRWVSDGFYLAVATTPLPALRVLRLSYYPPSASAVAALAAAPHLLAGLRELHAYPRADTAGLLKSAFGDRLRPTGPWAEVAPEPPT